MEHGDQYQLRLVYEHNLQRTACNMTYGPFGGVTGEPVDDVILARFNAQISPFSFLSYFFFLTISSVEMSSFPTNTETCLVLDLSRFC